MTQSPLPGLRTRSTSPGVARQRLHLRPRALLHLLLSSLHQPPQLPLPHHRRLLPAQRKPTPVSRPPLRQYLTAAGNKITAIPLPAAARRAVLSPAFSLALPPCCSPCLPSRFISSHRQRLRSAPACSLSCCLSRSWEGSIRSVDEWTKHVGRVDKKVLLQNFKLS